MGSKGAFPTTPASKPVGLMKNCIIPLADNLWECMNVEDFERTQGVEKNLGPRAPATGSNYHPRSGGAHGCEVGVSGLQHQWHAAWMLVTKR